MLDKIFGLHNKNVLITGAAGLLGQKHAEAVCMAGGRPILADIDIGRLTEVKNHLSKAFDSNALILNLDITSEDKVKEAAHSLVGQGVKVDVLINNAARNPKVGSSGNFENNNRLENFPISELMLDFNVGIVGAINCTKVFGAQMAKAGRGVIVNVASDLGVIAPDQRLYQAEGKKAEEQDVKPVSYSIVKHGLIGLTKYTATYWADRGVRCNAISPGGVFNNQNAVFLSKIQKLIPMQRMANADEYQGAIIFLSSEASSYMNGGNLIVDGGRSVW